MQQTDRNIEPLDTHAKALAINLDPSIFGTFAEIGAGQETARWFLRVGAASGTVAKTICAYDKAVSDELYGTGSRYVSKERLASMLQMEWRHLEHQVANRAKPTRAFVYANTVATRNFSGTSEGHGWLGLQFCKEPCEEPQSILLHAMFRDPTAIQQQESIGVLGVDLIYAAYHHTDTPESFLCALRENWTLESLEIDLIETSGSRFESWDQRMLLANMVSRQLSSGVLLPRAGDCYLPLNEAFYKTPVVAEPGHFENHQPIYSLLLTSAMNQLASTFTLDRPPRAIFCLYAVEHDAHALLKRAIPLLNEGYDVLLTRHAEMYRISSQLREFTQQPIRFVVGLSFVVRLINFAYSELKGRILEGLGCLFQRDVSVYVYPMTRALLEERLPREALQGWHIQDMDAAVTTDSIKPPQPLDHMYDFLRAAHLIEGLKVMNED